MIESLNVKNQAGGQVGGQGFHTQPFWGGFSICSSIKFVYQKNSSITYASNNIVGTYVQIVDVGIKNGQPVTREAKT